MTFAELLDRLYGYPLFGRDSSAVERRGCIAEGDQCKSDLPAPKQFIMRIFDGDKLIQAHTLYVDPENLLESEYMGRIRGMECARDAFAYMGLWKEFREQQARNREKKE